MYNTLRGIYWLSILRSETAVRTEKFAKVHTNKASVGDAQRRYLYFSVLAAKMGASELTSC